MYMVKELSSHGLYVKTGDDLCHAKALFILESPYFNELMENHACAGLTGKNLAGVLNLGKEKSLGTLLNDGDSVVEDYAVFNMFKFPLDISLAIKMLENGKEFDLWNNTQIPWCILKNSEGSGVCALQKCIQTINKEPSCKAVFDECKNSFFEFLTRCDRLDRIVVCGYIAQAMFQEIIGQTCQVSSMPFPIANSKLQECIIRYSIHPSRNFSSKTNAGKMVKEFLGL